MSESHPDLLCLSCGHSYFSPPDGTAPDCQKCGSRQIRWIGPAELDIKLSLRIKPETAALVGIICFLACLAAIASMGGLK